MDYYGSNDFRNYILRHSSYAAVSREDYLMHYGRLGMKWGQHIYSQDPASGASVRRVTSTKGAFGRNKYYVDTRNNKTGAVQPKRISKKKANAILKDNKKRIDDAEYAKKLKEAETIGIGNRASIKGNPKALSLITSLDYDENARKFKDRALTDIQKNQIKRLYNQFDADNRRRIFDDKNNDFYAKEWFTDAYARGGTKQTFSEWINSLEVQVEANYDDNNRLDSMTMYYQEPYHSNDAVLGGHCYTLDYEKDENGKWKHTYSSMEG